MPVLSPESLRFPAGLEDLALLVVPGGGGEGPYIITIVNPISWCPLHQDHSVPYIRTIV